jgi:palmitoyl-protein thioesterase
VKNATYKVNFSSLKNLVLVRANADTMVFPKESEWFGAFEDGSYSKVLGFNETKWYKEDSFGLQTLHRAGNVHFFETQGNHLQFTDKFLFKVVDQFFH